ncbi:hypothetical protein [Actinoalloteichus sp. GBA129-24]|uniref:phage tail tube protein n=1 Tax=Actinoalloteichus sp. GBA129-24 TaxID=1612551 RepID=UPI000950AF2F|nr:hypothetical protein [Actinoalloteichus sp. GBA129-24]APU20949.1 hypothetical protein UA75_14695 [Actinoalloteichus sp. GBA129-24]APU24198.1 hypothetical protein UA75_31175 [Actinoalloteichus sp. GBA129-24]
MSQYADPALTRVWLDGDAFRAPAGTALPDDIFAEALDGWDAFGGIKAGFEVERTTEVTRHTIWNSRGTYRQTRGNEEPVIRLRPVDFSIATAMTLLTGGTTEEGAGGFEWVEGDDERFALILRVVDGDTAKAYYVENGELANRPTEALNADDVQGWDLEITPLVPDGGGRAIRVFTTEDPLASVPPVPSP